MKRLFAGLVICLGIAVANLFAAPADTDAAAEKLWKEVLDAGKPPAPPADWNGKTPSDEQKAAFKKELSAKAAEAAEKARQFYTKYPKHAKVAEAQAREKKMLETAAAYGDEASAERLKQSPALDDDEKLQAKINELHKRAMERRPEGMEALLKEFEGGARELLKEYPDRAEVWQLLMLVGDNAPEPKAKEIYKEIIASSAPDSIKQGATGALKKLDAIGLPLEMAFTATDGRKIDLQKMKGKVVLVDFWATWCGPCVKEIPNVRRVYEEMHDQGFEIVGISFDKSRPALDSFVEQNKMTWPQYFDGQGWGNKFGIQHTITSIPTMWLVDKKGLLRDLNAREDLEEKIKKLLAEEGS